MSSSFNRARTVTFVLVAAFFLGCLVCEFVATGDLQTLRDLMQARLDPSHLIVGVVMLLVAMVFLLSEIAKKGSNNGKG